MTRVAQAMTSMPADSLSEKGSIGTAKARLSWIDTLRGLAIVLVVVGHSAPPDSLLNRIIYTFHLPVFFFLSGYLFSLTQRETRSFFKVTISNFTRLVFPYIATGLIVYLYWLNILRTQSSDPNSASAMGLFNLRNFAYGTGNPVSQLPLIGPIGPIWFLLALFVSVLIFWLLVRISRPLGWIGRFVLVAGVSAGGVIVGQNILLPWSADIAMAAQILMLAGYEAHRLRVLERMKWWWVPGLLAVWVVDIVMSGLSMNNREYGIYPLAVVGAVAVILVLAKVAQSLHPRFLTFLGVESLVILCYHTMDDGFFHWNWLPITEPLYAHWYLLALFRIFYSLLIVAVIQALPVVRTAYYWDRWPPRLPWKKRAG